MAQTDNNAVKQLALDHLGVIAARLRTSTLKFKPATSATDGNTSTPLRPMEEVAKTFITCILMRFLMCCPRYFPAVVRRIYNGLSLLTVRLSPICPDDPPRIRLAMYVLSFSLYCRMLKHADISVECARAQRCDLGARAGYCSQAV